MLTLLTFLIYTPDLVRGNSTFGQLPDEICDNGLDDDGDGLYDAYDPDCDCEIVPAPLSYLSNGDFENFDQCCANLEAGLPVCIDNWFLITESPDYINPNCVNTDFGLFDLAGIAYTGGFIDVGPSNETNGNVKSESLGICLDNPLKACQQYTVTFNTIMLSVLDFAASQEDLFYTIYGLPTCPSPQDIDPTQSFCNNPLSDQAQEILSFNALDLDRDEWVRFVDLFIPDFDISAMVIYVRCNQQVTVTGTPFLYFDNFEFLAGAIQCPINGQIDVSGDACNQDILLTATATNPERYQWFKDSIPIIGADSMTFVPDLQNSEGSYSVLITNNVECTILDPVLLQESMSMNTFLFDTICPGQEFLYGFDTLRTSGIYTRSLGTATNGCQLLEILDLHVISPIIPIVDFSPGLTVTVGDTLYISIDSDFLNQVEAFSWTEDGQTITPNNPNIVSVSNQPKTVQYLLDYTFSGVCERTATFPVEWISPLPTDEVCSNGIDDDQDGLIDTFDDDCPCTIATNNDVQVSESICAGGEYRFGNESLSETGVYQDTFVNAVNCDSIITLSLLVLEDQVDTIYEEILEGEQFIFSGSIYTEAGWYSNVVIDNVTNCDSTYVLRLDIITPLNVYIPNAIRLSSLSGNDKFYISPNKPIIVSDLRIYNRWGNLVHHTDRVELDGDSSIIWDGTFNSQNVSQGLYVFSLSYTDGMVSEQVFGDLMVMD